MPKIDCDYIVLNIQKKILSYGIPLKAIERLSGVNYVTLLYLKKGNTDRGYYTKQLSKVQYAIEEWIELNRKAQGGKLKKFN